MNYLVSKSASALTPMSHEAEPPGLTPAHRHLSPLVTVLGCGVAARTGRSEHLKYSVRMLINVTKLNLTSKLFLKKV